MTEKKGLTEEEERRAAIWARVSEKGRLTEEEARWVLDGIDGTRELAETRADADRLAYVLSKNPASIGYAWAAVKVLSLHRKSVEARKTCVHPTAEDALRQSLGETEYEFDMDSSSDDFDEDC